jgi:hypothetical protein
VLSATPFRWRWCLHCNLARQCRISQLGIGYRRCSPTNNQHWKSLRRFGQRCIWHVRPPPCLLKFGFRWWSMHWSAGSY